jgi:hypothetical protein
LPWPSLVLVVILDLNPDSVTESTTPEKAFFDAFLVLRQLDSKVDAKNMKKTRTTFACLIWFYKD